VNVTGLAGFNITGHSEPESVSINKNNIAAITLKENNRILLINLMTKTIQNSFSEGTVNLDNIDSVAEGIFDQSSNLSNVLRESDGIVFISDEHFVTSDGGSRSFTIFNQEGQLQFSSGSGMDQSAASVGYYPDKYSDKNGNEPENVDSGKFGFTDYLFVDSKHSSLVFLYYITKSNIAKLRQVLPSSDGPRGITFITSSGLLFVAGEVHDHDNYMRSGITIYEYSKPALQYPTLGSKRNKKTGVAIPWGSISGISSDPSNNNILYAVDCASHRPTVSLLWTPQPSQLSSQRPPT